jgi:peptidoglycan/xylan/chitin deacetylase (PgdA/CDA1 family)
VTTVTLEGWSRAPKVGVMLPDEHDAGWIDAAFWCALIDAWGFRAGRISPHEVTAAGCTTLVLPTASLDGALLRHLQELDPTTILLVGSADPIPMLPDAHRFPETAATLEAYTTEGVVDRAHDALVQSAEHGLVGMWRWPDAADAALVVDGDVDHPTGVDPECARYVAPAIETMRRAGYPAYGIFAAAANVDAEPQSFPDGADYYNHSYSHPYSHWNPQPWEALDDDAMTEEILRSNATFREHLGQDDHGMFRLPHFQLQAADRTYAVLDQLAYRADSSIGGNLSVTGGLPFHPAPAPWSDRPQDAGHARTHPDVAGRHRILQLPISTDPTDLDFPNGCCSYNTLGEGVRDRTADPDAYEEVLETVLQTALARHGLAHLFIDPPDAGYGRLPGDTADYASAVERWLARAGEQGDRLSVMTTAELGTWWLAREEAVAHTTSTVEHGRLIVDIPEAPPGATLTVREPNGARTLVPLIPAAAS